MRFIRTFLVRLYMDTDAPDRLCGELRPVETRGTYPFKNEYSLTELLLRLSIENANSERSSLSELLRNTE